ncbi:MAG: DUF348 domain-containing protein [Chloroflexi bacterium]|nr:DUF348 domain-containing protein [Chloroflexota bacterium]
MFGYPVPRSLIVVAAIALAALALGGLSLRQKSATVSDGDQTVTFSAESATVGGALASAGIALFPEDIVQPSAESPLDSGTAIVITRALPVQIIEGGVALSIRTHQRKISAIILESGKTVSPEDAVYADGVRLPIDQWDAVGAIPHVILIQRATPITIIDGSTTHTIITAARTVGEAIAEAGITLFAADGVTPPLGAPITSGLTISIERSLPITIEVDGRSLQTRTHRTTVAEVLADTGVTLVGADTTTPALDAPPPADGSPIRVARVVEQIVIETKPLPYETQHQAVADLEIDNVQIIQAGAYGTTASRVRVRYENGIEISRAAEDTWVSIAAQPRILGYGAKIVVRTLDTPDGPIEYWRAIRMYATSYSAARAGTPRSAPWYGRTRSGKTLTIGMAAIDLRVMPLGTRLYVPGYGFATAEDTGGGVKGKWIDLGYDDWNYVGWNQSVTVYFLTPVPPADQIKWVIP